MKKTARTVTSACLLGATSLTALPAASYNITWCQGTPVAWPGTFRMYRDLCSMPTNSDQDWSYWNAGYQWSRISQRIDWNWWYDSGCKIQLGNGRSETGLVDRAQISGNNGYTIFLVSACVYPWRTPSVIEEADTKLAADLDFSPINTDDVNHLWEDMGRAINVHEFGHAHGLNHANPNDFSVCRNSSTEPLAGVNICEPGPDDGNAMRRMYGGTVTNIYTSPDMLVNGDILRTNAGTLNTCSGQTINGTYTVANNGSVRLSGVPFNISLRSTDGTVSALMYTGSASISAGTQFTETRSLVVPNVPFGSYWIYWSLQGGSGDDSQDNTSHEYRIIHIGPC